MLCRSVCDFCDMVDDAGVGRNTCCRIFMYYLCCCKCLCCRNGCRRYMTDEIYDSSNDILFGELL